MREKQQEWCFRLDQQLRVSSVSYFVTLTYEDEQLTYAGDEPCVDKRDVQLFLKKLRKRLEPKTLKYYLVAEYGDKWRPITPNGRPHYHALLFYSGNTDRWTLHLMIKDCWHFGIAQVLPVLGAQGYVTKYILKFDKRDHLVKPFALISHGLGLSYLSSSMISYHRENLLPYAIKPGGFKVNLPRYYKDKIFSTYQRLLMKKRADLFRHDLEIKRLENYDLKFGLGINPFFESIQRYQEKLYNSIKLYKNKKKL